MNITKIKKGPITYDINDPRVPELLAADKYLHTVEENGEIVLELADAPTEIPALPEGASEKTYAFKAVNGVLTWVEEVAPETEPANDAE